MKIIRYFITSTIFAASMFVLISCQHGLSENDYKSAIEEHMKSSHGTYVEQYSHFSMNENGSTAEVKVTLDLVGGGKLNTSPTIKTNNEGNIIKCELCDLF